MKKIIHVLLKVILSVILFMPILGTLHIFPAPTADLYNTPQAFEFITILMTAGYINYMMAVVFAISLFLLWTNRVALAVLLILPITLNVVGFHLFLDGGLLTGGALLGNVMLAINIYFLWQHRMRYLPLLDKEN